MLINLRVEFINKRNTFEVLLLHVDFLYDHVVLFFYEILIFLLSK